MLWGRDSTCAKVSQTEVALALDKNRAFVTAVAVILVLGAYGVFLLPYAFPYTVPMYDSPVYNVGFNTSVAIASLLAAILALTVSGVRYGARDGESVLLVFAPTRPEDGGCERMPFGVLVVFISLYCLLHSFFYYAIPHLDDYSEAGFHLKHYEVALRYQRYPYRDVGYPYGPILFYVPLGFITMSTWWGFSIEYGYLLVLMINAAVGLAILFWLVDTFNVDVTCRIVIFSALAIEAYEFGMGMASTMVRYATPFALLVLSHRMSHRFKALEDRNAFVVEAATSLVTSLLTLGISPEFGVIFMIGRAVYSTHRALCGDRNCFAGVVGLLPVLPIWWMLFPESLGRVLGGNRGFLNFPILPGPHILFFLGTTVWVVSRLLQCCATAPLFPATSLALAWVAMAVGLTPAALGRCEHVHVFLNGMSMFLLAMVLLAHMRSRRFVYYMIGFVIVYAVIMRVALVVDAGPGLVPLRLALGGQRVASGEQIDFVVLKEALELDDLTKVAIPLGADGSVRRYLVQSGRYEPSHYLMYSEVATQVQLDRKLRDLRNASYLLVPERIFTLKGVSDADVLAYRRSQQEQVDRQISIWLGTHFMLPYRCKTLYMPFDPMLEESRYIANHYKPIRSSGGWAIAVRDE